MELYHEFSKIIDHKELAKRRCLSEQNVAVIKNLNS